MSNAPVTSPELATNSGLIKDAKSFSGAMTLDLTDEEIANAWKIVIDIRRKWMRVFRSKYNDSSTYTLDQALKSIEEFEDELKTTLAERCGILASVNTVPLLEGKPMEIEWIGKMPGSGLDTIGMDHEKKEYEVKKATARGEDFLGQKGK
jgi:hypothetical protein